MDDLAITVKDAAGLDRLRPVTGGVPIAEGAAPEGVCFALSDGEGAPVPLDAAVLARWPDGSARWVLLDFQSAPAGEARYVLSWRDGDRVTLPETPLAHECGEWPSVGTGDVSVSTGEGRLLSIGDRFDVALSLTDGAGQVCAAAVEAAELERVGRLRSTIALRGAFRTEAGERVVGFRLRVSLYAGLSVMRLEPMILADADRGILQRFRELGLAFRPRAGAQAGSIGGAPGWEGESASAVRLLQVDDERYRLEPVEGNGGKAPGWAELDDGHGRLAAAVRDFWQRWPASLEVGPDGLSVGLLPAFREGDFAHMEPWYKYQYPFDGDSHRLRMGQALRWDIWVGLDGDGESLARMANAPLVPAADPAQATAAGVWGAIAPAGSREMADYDPWAERLFEAYCRSIECQRDYGAMNWGDWFGERKVNWGNHEYDTPDQLLVQFARTGDLRCFYAADAAARHMAEVDTVHFVNDDLAAYFNDNFGRPDYPPRPGMVHQHAVGHVGSFYPIETVRELLVEHGIGKHSGGKPYTCLDPFNLGHIWTQGLVRHYFLTGDPFIEETVRQIADNLAQLVEDREYRFMGHTHCGRTTGWPLLALGAACELAWDDRYLAAMRTLVDDALELQDPVCGGWIIQPMAADHCICKTARHTGMATFITAVLINGLARYYELTADERLPHAIDEAVTYINNDTWRENLRGWRYTSCPGHRTASQPGVVIMAYVNAVRITGNPEHLRILRLAWSAKFRRLLEAPPPGPGHGKAYTATMYGCPEAAALLATPQAEETEE